MDKEWSEKNKVFQKLISKEATFKDGIKMLLELRASVFEQITQIVNGYPEKAFYEMPFTGAGGYHSKTLAYSIWHIFRIEDIVAHEMLECNQQILFRDGYVEKIKSPTITTGNELCGKDIAEFSKCLDRWELYNYAKAVLESTNQILQKLEYTDLKKKFGDEFKKKLIESKCVSGDKKAVWLLDYWCGKDVKGLLKMPFSRHWIMHVEAMRRIKNELCKKARKGVDPIACCGFSCNHCFLSQWCGSCRTEYNTCSFATCSPDGICPNTKCCKEKGFDGCWECSEIESCTKGFYVPECDGANAAKAQSLYIRKHGKKEFLKLQDRLHKKFNFSKTQEILGQDIMEGLRLLEEN
ncbi:MAG: DUF3795 domain-containing protein [Spirochaetales bacterium]|nr:DUF3795 domain-containing protein [Spirochaetales bacterium]